MKASGKTQTMERPLLDNMITSGVKAGPTEAYEYFDSFRPPHVPPPELGRLRNDERSQALEAAELGRVKSASEKPSDENGNWGGEPRDA